MSKKQKKIKQNIQSEGQEGGHSNGRQNQKKEQDFQCKCGKKYGSLAAVHTHINNKHPNQKKQYKLAIKNPKKTGQGPSTSIRMKDIAYHEQEAELMCATDTTLKQIYDAIKSYDQGKDQITKFLLDENDIDSCEQLDMNDDDFDFQKIQKSERENEITRLVQEMKDNYQIKEINKIIKDCQELQVFKLKKFNLTLIRQLTKFFNINFASKIKLQLQIIIAKNKQIDNNIRTKLLDAQIKIWGQMLTVRQKIEQYYLNWLNIRRKNYKSNS